MLILARKQDESIIIGDDIQVKVIRVQGNQVHLGISAPRSVTVHRQEIYEQAKSENLKAAHGKSTELKDRLGALPSLMQARTK
ncbi:MAG: carbon storage regulator [Lentisphaerae bacterium RIFOXYB12_FULL_65_16]|nr:MAG: carbon storage regulator [Lentisphaerae bacterium RIFOXYA12_64_32]OGV88886.1 MAG: carbon storage regulator [Lentisphaerae bacterium RIFOXYB12_FULL_65_16]